MKWDRMLAEYYLHDGFPIEGVATYRGEPHLYESQRATNDLFLLLPMSPELQELAQERLEIGRRLYSRLRKGAPPSGDPLQGDHERFEELRTKLHVLPGRTFAEWNEQRHNLPSNVIVAWGSFRRTGYGDTDYLVRWTPAPLGELDIDPVSGQKSDMPINRWKGYPTDPKWPLPLTDPTANNAVLGALQAGANATAWHREQMKANGLPQDDWERLFEIEDRANADYRAAIDRFADAGDVRELAEALDQVSTMLNWRPGLTPR